MTDVATHTLKYIDRFGNNLPVASATPIQLMEIAAFEGKIQVLEWFHSIGYTAKNIYAENYALYKKGITPYNCSICRSAAQGGQLEALQWLHKMGFIIDDGIWTYAAHSTNVELFEWILLIKPDTSVPTHALQVAAAAQSPEFLKFVHKTWGISWEVAVLVAGTAAAVSRSRYGGLELMLKIIKTQKPELQPVWVVSIAAYNGHFEDVKWLIENGYPRGEALAGALAGEQTQIVEWLRSTGTTEPANYVKIKPENDAKSPGFILNTFHIWRRQPQRYF